jgi:hypothetical protein
MINGNVYSGVYNFAVRKNLAKFGYFGPNTSIAWGDNAVCTNIYGTWKRDNNGNWSQTAGVATSIEVNQASSDIALPLVALAVASEYVGSVVATAVGTVAIGALSVVALVSLQGDSRHVNVVNPNLEGTRTSTGPPSIYNDGDFDNTEDYFRPGSTPPKWFWPLVAAAAGYEIYNNWPLPETLKKDKTYNSQPVFKPAP